MISSAAARRSAARSPSARGSARQAGSSAPRPKLRSSRSARPLSASKRSIRRSARWIASSSSSSRLPRRAPSSCSASRPWHAGQLLVTAGQNIERLHGESSFAMLCGASPIPCLVRQDDPSPPQLRRRPPSQPVASPHRRLPAALLRAHPRIRQAPNRRRQDSARNHALPQALHRA